MTKLAPKRTAIILLLILLTIGLSATLGWAATTYDLVFGGSYAAASKCESTTDEQYAGAGSWYELHPSPVSGSDVTELYISPSQLGGAFTIDQIQSITYHTLNDATNPSDVDFFLRLYTEPFTGGDSGWYGHRLNGEPLYANNYSGPVTGVWNTWTTDAGTNQLTLVDHNHAGCLGFYGAPTLQDVQAGAINWSTWPGGCSGDATPIDYGPEQVLYVSFATGSGWASFEGYLDYIEIALTSGDTYQIDLEDYVDEVWVDDDWVGCTPGAEVDTGKFCGHNAFATVQDGINNVAGSTVHVAAGTYSERVTINKPVDLRGAQYGVDPTATGARTNPANESIITEAGLSTPNPDVLIEIPSGVTNVSVDGFTLSGDPTNATADTSTFRVWDDNVAINNNIINGRLGVLYKGADGLTVHQNRLTVNKNGVIVQPNAASNVVISDSTFALGASPAGDESPIYMTSCTACDVTGNTASGFVNSGAVTGNNLKDIEVSGNVFAGNRDGVSFWGNTTFVDISNNDLSNSARYGVNIKGQDITITGNQITNCGDSGVRVDVNTIETRRVAIHYNNISGNTNYGVNVQASHETVDAEKNWWGDATGPDTTGATSGVSNPHDPSAGGDKAAGDVDAVPWLATSTTTPSTEYVSVTHNPVIAVSNNIQAAINAALPGDILNVAAGTYNENILINKHVDIIGAGSSTSGTVITQNASGAGDTKIGVVQLAASGVSDSDPLLLRGLRIEPDGLAGISVGRFTEATAVSVSYVELDNVHVIGNNTNPNTEQERGLYVDLTSSLRHLKVTDCAFDNLTYGWYLQKQVSADTSTVQYVEVTGTTFNHNNLKGFYAEKLSDASFTSCVVDDNGFSSDGVPSYFLPYMSGFDINLKAGTYQNLTFSACTITDNALGGAKEGVGLTVKGRGTGSDPSYATFPAYVSNVTVDDCDVTGNERGLRFGEPGKDNTTPTNVDISDSCISGNVQTYGGSDGSAYGGVVNLTTVGVTAESNWWGDASGPTHASNPSGTGDAVTDGVDFTPWVTDGCDGSSLEGDWENVRTGALNDLQDSLDDAIYGDEIKAVGDSPLSGGATANTAGVTINLNGKTVGPGSPFLTVAAADVAVIGPGTIDGGGSSDPGILIQSGGDNFILETVELTGWADGIELAADVTSLKIVSNWIHSNTDAGLQVNSGVSLDGVVTIEGNLFKVNGGNGIQNDGDTDPLPAEYNSWGDVDGPATATGGDGISAKVDAEPFTFIEFYMDVDPDFELLQRDVVENETFDVKIKAEAVDVYGLAFQFTYDKDLLTLNGTTFTSPWDGGVCTSLSATAGTVAYFCGLKTGPEWDGGTIATFEFTADLPGIAADDDGPWTGLFDIAHEELYTNAGAIGGAKIFVNNAGYNDPSNPDRDITDGNDGQIDIDGQANYTGFVDLQGRSRDNGATLTVYDVADKGTSTALADGDSSSSGKYTTAYIPPGQLVVGTTYYFQLDAPLYLPTTQMAATGGSPPIPSDWSDSKLLDTRPLTTLGTALLLGGDATDDDAIDVSDASCVGWDYGSSTSTCATGSSDVNGDGTINILDLTLMGGNYDLASSDWTP